MPDEILRILTDPLFQIFVAIIVIGGTIQIFARVKSNNAWAQLAARHQLTPRRKKGETVGVRMIHHVRYHHDLVGRYRDHDVELTQHATQQRKYHTSQEMTTDIWTRIALKLNKPQTNSLRIAVKPVLGKKAASTGLITDKDLDRFYSITGEPEHWPYKALESQSLRQSLLMLGDFHRILLFDGQLIYDQYNEITKLERLERILDFLADVANEIE